MKKLISVSLMSIALLFCGVTSAAAKPNTIPHVVAFKNKPKAFIGAQLLQANAEVPHVTVFNDPNTWVSFSVSSNGAIVTLAPGDKVDFFYYNFESGPQAVTIISGDSKVVFNGYVADESFMRILTIHGNYEPSYQVVFE